jgi:hypothetical protein
MPEPQAGSYQRIITEIFNSHFEAGLASFVFDRDEIPDAARRLGIDRPGNVGDVIYSYRFRRELPEAIRDTAPSGLQWVIRLAGRGRYRFAAVQNSWLEPDPSIVVTKVPDATPEILKETALNDEQAVLARVRYNRLVDLFLEVTAYSLQNHLRTSAEGIGQTEIDEVYVAVDRNGAQYVIPVQAKGGTDKIGIVQVEQDIYVCRDKWVKLTTRPVAAQFLRNGDISLFELALQDDEIVKVREARYRLVEEPLTDEDRTLYASRSGVALPHGA